MITFSDRKSDNPNRRKLSIISQSSEEIIADIVYDDSPQPNCNGTPLNAKTFNDLQVDMMRQVVELKNGVKITYVKTDWENNLDTGNTALYKIPILNSTHGLSESAKVVYFNDGSDEFEWVKDENGNITIFSNVKVDMTVNLN